MQQKLKTVKSLYYAGQMTIAELSNKLQKSLPIMAKIVEELIEGGIVEEKGLASSTGGRRALNYSLKKDAFYIISVSMDQLFTKIAIFNMNNEQVMGVEKLDLPLKDNEDALNQLIKGIEQYIINTGVDRTKILGIGIGMPGFIDVKKGINYSFLKQYDSKSSIVEIISNKIDLPVYIDNDSSLIALAELRFGSAKGTSNTMVINMSWGVGLGILINDELYRGFNGFAGEFSHIPLFTNNKLCGCGKTGCLETETSLLVLIEKAKLAIANGRSSKIEQIDFKNIEMAYTQIIKYAIDGDSLAVELLSEIGYKIGRGIAILVHLLNPELVVLSGKGAIAKHIWQTPIQQAINEFCIPRLASNLSVKVSNIGNEAELIGAATLVIENINTERLAYKLTA